MNNELISLNVTPLPWQTDHWQRLTQAHQQGRLPHAYLLAGPVGVGKQHLAQAWAQYVLCEMPKQTACGTCHACRLFQVGHHPDYVLITPEEGAQVIKIDQIRALQNMIQGKAQLQGYRVVILMPAETLNAAAANALLKSLEEPGVETLFLLISHRPQSLMATVRSRCQRLVCPIPQSAQCLTWLRSQVSAEDQAESLLQAARGAPLKALILEQDVWFARRQAALESLYRLKTGRVSPAVLAKEWQEEAGLALLQHWGIWLLDLLKVCASVSMNQLTHPDLHPAYEQLSRHFNVKELCFFQDRLSALSRILLQGTALNSQLWLESLCIHWYAGPAMNE